MCPDFIPNVPSGTGDRFLGCNLTCINHPNTAADQANPLIATAFIDGSGFNDNVPGQTAKSAQAWAEKLNILVSKLLRSQSD